MNKLLLATLFILTSGTALISSGEEVTSVSEEVSNQIALAIQQRFRTPVKDNWESIEKRLRGITELINKMITNLSDEDRRKIAQETLQGRGSCLITEEEAQKILNQTR